MPRIKKIDEEIDVFILGADGVGRSSLIRRVSVVCLIGHRFVNQRLTTLTQYVHDIYDDSFGPALDDSEVRQVKYIFGNLCYIRLRRVHSPHTNQDLEAGRIAEEADAVLFMYDGNDAPRGLEEIRELQRAVVAPNLQHPLPMVLVAAKADIASDGWEDGLMKGQELAGELGARFCVTSSVWGDGVKDTVDQLVAEVLRERGVEAK